MVSPEELARVRELGRRQRRAGAADFRRRALGGIIDVGDLSDDDVQQLYAAYRAGLDEAEARPQTPPTPPIIP